MDSTIIGTFLLIPFLCVCVKVWVYIDLVYASTSLTDFDAVKETEPSLGNYNCFSVFKAVFTFQFQSIVPLVLFPALSRFSSHSTVTVAAVTSSRRKHFDRFAWNKSSSILCTRESHHEIELNYVNRERKKGNKSNYTDNKKTDVRSFFPAYIRSQFR